MIIQAINTDFPGTSLGLDLRILREDLFPCFGGGNKARKLVRIIEEIKRKECDAVVTTGSVYSNHCRATALMCSNQSLDLTLVIHGTRKQFSRAGVNARIIKATGHHVVFCEPEKIALTMDQVMKAYRESGKRPYYLHGGGHNPQGVEAYKQVVSELMDTFGQMYWWPDYIFLPSGTGSTQAGLVIGSIENKAPWQIIGISIARNKAKGMDSIREAFGWFNMDLAFFDHTVHFTDAYLAGGYGKYNKAIRKVSAGMLRSNSLFMDTTYTAKAFWGTLKYIGTHHLGNKKILFIHTGGLYNYLY